MITFIKIFLILRNMAFFIAVLLMPMLIIYLTVLVFLVIASISDLKTREVPDWLNYGSIGVGIGFNLIFSLVYADYSFIGRSLTGLGITFVLAYLLFYTGQWGGGDSKALMGIGALLGLDWKFYKLDSMPFIFSFLINILIAGAAYGLLWTIFLAVKNRKKFEKEVKSILNKKNVKRIKIVLLAFALIALAASFFPLQFNYKILIFGFAIIFYSTFYIWILTKAVERSCMQKYVLPSKLTEGDWIVNDIKIGGKRICGPKDLGIEKKQIEELVKYYKLGKIKKVLIKEGIPFVPSFLIGYAVTLVFGNILGYLIN